jgi:hypothetical protein
VCVQVLEVEKVIVLELSLPKPGGMCYRHNLTGPEDGLRTTWAEGDNRDGLRIGFCASVLRAGMAVCLSKDSLNMVS